MVLVWLHSPVLPGQWQGHCLSTPFCSKPCASRECTPILEQHEPASQPPNRRKLTCGYAIRKVMTIDHVLIFSLHQLQNRHFSVILYIHTWWNKPCTIRFPWQLTDSTSLHRFFSLSITAFWLEHVKPLSAVIGVCSYRQSNQDPILACRSWLGHPQVFDWVWLHTVKVEPTLLTHLQNEHIRMLWTCSAMFILQWHHLQHGRMRDSLEIND